MECVSLTDMTLLEKLEYISKLAEISKEISSVINQTLDIWWDIFTSED